MIMKDHKAEKAILGIIRRYAAAGYFPSASVRIFDARETLACVTYGDARPDSVFDVASLTKIATATQILRLMDEGRVRLSDEIGIYFPELQRDAYLSRRLRGITVEMLLTHTSTLVDWYPFYIRAHCGEDFWATLSYALEHTEATRGVVYSDLNFMILGKLLETLYDRPMETVLQENLVEPLKLGVMLYRPSPELDIIPSDFGNAIEMEMCEARHLTFDGFRPLGVPVVGTVHDGNTHYYFHDVSGLAGIFADTAAYMRLCQVYMNTDSPYLLRAQEEQTISPGRGLGLQTGLIYPDGCGHTGFTGTSIYFSRTHRIGVAAFTNRLYYADGHHRDLSDFRRALHETVLALYGA
mgnify:CR=1 FL=1